MCKSGRFPLLFVTVIAVVGAIAVDASLGDDWPQWMGPNRDNVWREAGVIRSIPDNGPPVVWKASVAGGYSGPAVADGRVFVTDYVTADDVKVANFERNEFSGVERVNCFDQQTGNQLWQHAYSVKYTMSYPAGPRCTPTVDGDRVYTLGGEGHLYCFAADTGDVVWQKDLVADYATKSALWGYAGHPLIDGEKLICVVGGEGSHAVAFNKLTGKEIWRNLSSPEQGYSPPTMIEAGGARQLILLRPNAVSGVDPETGKEYWSIDYEATNGSIIMSPIQAGEYLYLGGYSNKNLLLKLDTTTPAVEEVWRDLSKQAVSPVNVQPILDGMTLYGMDQRGTFVAVDLPSGQRLWETPQPLGDRAIQSGTAFITRQGDRYWLFTEQGDLVLASLSRDGFRELGRTHLIGPTNVAFGRDVVWAAPAFAGKCIFVRNDEQCICIDLSL